MIYGLQTFNPTGNVQIDSRFEGIVELTRGEFPKIGAITGNLGGDGFGGDVFGGDLPIQHTTNPKWLLLLRPTGKFTQTIIFSSTSPYNSGRVEVLAGGQSLKWVVGVPESENGRGDDDDYGLLIWNAEGKRVFNSAHYTIIPERVVIYTPSRNLDTPMPPIDVILPPLPENWEYYVNYNSVGTVVFRWYGTNMYEHNWTSLEFITDTHLKITQDGSWLQGSYGSPTFHSQGPRTVVIYKVRKLD